MTVIVGVVDGDQVWMGADSFTGNNQYALSVKEPKLFKAVVPQDNGDHELMLIGSSGCHRAGWLLRQATIKLLPHEADVVPLDYVANHFVTAVRALHKEHGYSWQENGREGGNAHILVGYKGRLFSIWDEFEVVEAQGYMAVGSGMYISLGALAATEGIDPPRRLGMVMDAAEKHHPFVRRPFVIENV